MFLFPTMPAHLSHNQEPSSQERHSQSIKMMQHPGMSDTHVLKQQLQYLSPHSLSSPSAIYQSNWNDPELLLSYPVSSLGDYPVGRPSSPVPQGNNSARLGPDFLMAQLLSFDRNNVVMPESLPSLFVVEKPSLYHNQGLLSELSDKTPLFLSCASYSPTPEHEQLRTTKDLIPKDSLELASDSSTYSDEDESQTSKGTSTETACCVRKISYKNEKRFRFDKSGMTILKGTYATNPLPSSSCMQELADRLEVDRQKIKIWFQNRRAVQKRREAVGNRKKKGF